MRAALLAPVLALIAVSCGGGEDGDEPAGNPSPAELANRIENVAFVPTDEEKEKAAPRRLGVLQEATLPAEYRSGRSCRLSQGANLLLVAAAPGAVAQIDGRIVRLRTAGPIGPSGGFFEAPGATVSIGLKPLEGAAVGTPTTRAGATVGGDDSKPLEDHEASWVCLG